MNLVCLAPFGTENGSKKRPKLKCSKLLVFIFILSEKIVFKENVSKKYLFRKSDMFFAFFLSM